MRGRRLRRFRDARHVRAGDTRGMTYGSPATKAHDRLHDTIDAAVYLAARRHSIVADAEAALAARVPRYVRAGDSAARDRLDLLYGRLVDALAGQNLAP